METIERIHHISIIGIALLLGLMSACADGESTLSEAPSETLVTVEQGIGECNILEAPIYRGAPVTMNTRSHGGGYSPAFEEFWYPQWSGTAVHRYDKDYNYLGYFNTGRNHVMQLWGLPGGDYLTAHWDLESVSRWQARSATEVWTTSLGTIIGGVAADDDFVYAMPHVGNTLWKLDKDSGEVIEQVAVPEQVGTLYGGLAVVGDTLFIGRAHGLVYRVDLDTLELIDTFETQINIYNMSFDGTDYCISPNTDSLFCYAICNDPLVPKAASQHISLQANEDADVTLVGSDDNNRDLTYEIVTRPAHGSLSGTAPNLNYEPIGEFVGFDAFTFKVNNGLADSEPVSVNFTILPEQAPPGECDPIHPPRYRGGVTTMNTRSHGGGFSPAYQEYWYPQWSGTTIHRYNKDHEPIGNFRTGRAHIMQLWGNTDGSYLTGHWDYQKVSKWQALSSNLIWSTELPVSHVGGVTAGENIVYAMGHTGGTVYKLDQDDGSILGSFTVPDIVGTLYGGLALIDNKLYIGRHNGRVYRVDLDTETLIDNFVVDALIYNMSFDGHDYCVSANNDSLFCFNACDDISRPRANTQQVSTQNNEAVNFTLTGTDPGGADLSFTVLSQPQHGALSGTAPNLTFTPLDGFVGFDKFSFKVNNGTKDSPAVDVNIVILPDTEDPPACDIVSPPTFTGGLVTMNTRSHGGGYSPAFKEYWYPQWAGRTIYRYSKDYEFLGTFRSGQDHIMQLSGDTDGSYFTAHWDYRKVIKWQALSDNLLWSTELPVSHVGGVAVAPDFVYAMGHTGGTVYKLSKTTGAVLETFSVGDVAGTLYGGLAFVDNKLYIGRHHGLVYRYDLNAREMIDTFNVDTNIYNMSFDGQDYCVSPNNSAVSCYNTCRDPNRPTAAAQQVSTNKNTAVNIALAGNDPNDQDLTFEIIERPSHGSLTGTAPNLTFTPIGEFVGFDSFTFKVTNEDGDESSTVRVSITIVPGEVPPLQCDLVDPPEYRGGAITMNTRSHGGGYSPAFKEYWYPQWTGGTPTVYRYNQQHQPVGSFTTGLSHVMQLWGLPGGDYLTATWSRKKVARWQGLSNNLVWSTELPVDYVGGVTAGPNVVYAMPHVGSTVYTLNPTTGAVTGTFEVPEMEGTLYGGLAYIDGRLYIGRHHGLVYQVDPEAPDTFIDTSYIDSYIYNMSFDGTQYCVSPNSSDVTCYAVCGDSRPTGVNKHVSTNKNTAVNFDLEGSDPDNQALSYTVLEQPDHGSVTVRGQAHELTYTPIGEFVGFDRLTFKVTNTDGDDSAVFSIDISVLPGAVTGNNCNALGELRYRGVATMNTRSHGGGYSPAFEEFWYPQWAGRTVYRYNKDHEFLGTFNTGRDHVMQLWGNPDGTYLTANWGRKKINLYQGKSAKLIWSTELPVDYAGGVTADDSFVYAMGHSSSDRTVFKLSLTTGEIVGQFTVPALTGTLYGGLAMVDGELLIGRHDGLVYKVDPDNPGTFLDTYTLDTNIYNMSFDGSNYCISPNTSAMTCYATCEDPDQPVAHTQHLSNLEDQSVNIALTGTDPGGGNLTYTVVDQPQHGALAGNAPNLVYTPINGYTGFDSFTFKVTNQNLQSSATVSVSIVTRPDIPDQGACNILNSPRYLGAPINMDTRSHGGGFSPAFGEYWYPEWSGRTVYRFDRNHDFLGTFTTGQDHAMQIWGNDDGTYYTANWDRKKVSKWQGLSADLIWSTELPVTSYVAGVTTDGTHVYAMEEVGGKLYKLNPATGALIETLTISGSMSGTLYGGLALVNGTLYIGRSDSKVYRVPLSNLTVQDNFSVATNVYSMSFDGNAYCLSNNTSDLHCYTICEDPDRPIANAQEVTTTRDVPKAIVLTGSDPGGNNLTFSVVDPPTNGTISGNAPNLTYDPNDGFVGIDSFTFKVNNGSQDSYAIRVGVTVTPGGEIDLSCDEVNPPEFRGAPVPLNTRSHGGGYSPAFGEYWYPHWSGTTVYRYNKDLQPVGLFRAGLGRIMQLWGDTDGSYYTAHWTYYKVSKYPAMSSNAVWTFDTDEEVVGGVTADEDFVYAMHYTEPKIWKLNKTTGALVETITLPSMAGTLYGGLAMVGDTLYVGRHHGVVYRVDMSDRTIIDSFRLGTNIYNMSYDGTDYCISANTDLIHCHNVCDDALQPSAESIQTSTVVNTPLNVTLEGSDPNDEPLTYTVIDVPEHGSLTGVAPNLTYTALTDFVGFDNFTYRVSNGSRNSTVARVTISILPDLPEQPECQLVDPPTYVGAPAVMDTKSYGGGYSPAYQEYWYPQWSGTTIHRYNKGREYIGSFNTGLANVMQLWGMDDGTYLTAHWGLKKVSRWQGLSANLVWSTELPVDYVGGVTAGPDFVYAMGHTGSTVYKLDPEDGSLQGSFSVEGVSGTNYGALTYVGGLLYIGNHNGDVIRYNIANEAVVGTFSTESVIRNTSFDGTDYCISPNSSFVYCYSACQDSTRPTALSQNLSVQTNDSLDITLEGNDPENRDLTYTIVTQPEHGTLTGTVPELTYEPIGNFTGFDAFSFKVNNGIKDSPVVQIDITILPDTGPVGVCDPTEAPTYVGSAVTMNTRSHGGGFSPAFGEYWYPAWGGTTVYRYNKDFQPVGTFTTGRGLVMQLWGETDGSYYTAHWTHNKVSKWPAMSSNAIWTTDTDGIVGGVTADKDFVYAMDYRAPTLWKMNKQNGTIIETIELPTMTGTLYGGLAIVDGLLYVGRHDGNLYKIDLEERTIVSQTTTSALIYNTSFNGQDYCISPNSSDMFCYSLCNDPTEPTAHIGHVSAARNTNTNITLTGEDPEDRDLTYTVVTRPAHGTLSGTAPNLVYSPIFNFVGADSFAFKVNNGLKDSPVVQVNITVLPNIPQPLDCTRIDPPTYRGSPITMDTKSYGGGYSPAFGEYWYPQWSGRTITRYDKEHRQIGTFTTGHSQVMQLWGDTDGSYYTAHWSLKKVGRWQGLSDIALWVTSTDDVVGGVTADENFVYAMAHAAPTLWKFNKETGALLATEELESMSGTLYGGLALVDGILYIARSTGTVYRYNLGTEEMSSFGVSTTVQNTSFNGTDICYSPNSDKMFCHTLCDDPDQPSANGRQFSTQANTPVSITLTGEDRQDRALTFTVTVQPEHGTLTGTAPNLTYTPVGNFTGIDSFSFKVNNGTKDSPAVSVGVSVLPEVEDLSVCPEGNRVDPPAYTGSPVTMETRSHGGGYSPGFDEYWYPHWSGRTIYRYDKNRRQIGTFLTGRDRVMQLWGLNDGTYLTAHWTHQSVSRWQAMSADALWTTNLDEVIGGVTASDTHVYAMAHSAAKVYKLDMTTGQLIETIAVPSTGSTLYGGLAYINGLLHVGRSDGRVYRMDLHDGDGDNDAPEIVSTFALDTNIYNMSFNGREFCASPNSDTNYCYTTCRDPARPTASGQQITTRVNTGATITLQGSDPNNQPLTYTVTQRPEHGTLTGTGANLTYTPILDFVGTDQLIFKVNNGTKDSLAVNVNIAILPDIDQPVACQLAVDPVYRGRAVTMNTRSHGGGYSPGFGEYWYPNWSGTTISRYSLERDFKGIFRTGGNKVMQLWGEPDGTYYTANWDNQKVSKWQGLSDNLIWSVNLGATVGGVTADADFVYAMAHQGTTAWKLDKDSGEVIEQFTVPSMPGTLYGGLAALDGDLLVGRDDRKLYRVDLATGTIVKVSSLAVRAYNMNFNGVDYCISENNSDVHCYAVCSNSANRAPFIETIADQAHSEGVNITLGVQAFDDDNNPLTFSASNLPAGLSINPATGVISGQINDGQQPNSPYSVVITVSDGLVSTTASFDWTVFDPDLPAPVFVSRTPESGWTNETPFTVEAHVTDTICTKRPIVFVQGRNLGTNTEDNQTAGWNIETDEVEGADVIHNFSIRVRSLCSDKTTASNVLVGIDQIDPTLNFPSGAGDFDQDGVDQSDPSTWPTLEESDLVSMLVLARDDKSGVAVGRATILPFDYDGNDLTPLNDKLVSIYDETFALVSQTPPTGPLIKSGGWCNNVGYCQGNSLRVPVLEGRFFELRLSLADKAGNAVEQVYRFRTIDLPTAIEQWKDAIDNATTNSAPAQSRLEDASELLDLALLGYAEGHYGNMFLGLEDAAGKIAEARLFDGDLDFQTEDILVSTLATEWLDLQKRLKLEENDENEFFDRVDIFLAQARANIALETPNSARAAFLDLANAFFFYEEAHSTQSATDYATCVPVMARILQSMDDYIENQPELPGAEPISEARVELTQVMEYLQLVVEEGDLTRSDLEHAEALMILTDAAETLKTAENTTAWIRQYQWGLTQIVYIYSERGITNAATFFGGNHPVIALGREQLEAADEFRQDFRADNFMDLLIDSRCMTIGIYNMTYEPDLDVPDACCELIEDYNELEPLIPIPGTCR